ncbi:hypothetical protein DFJ77DRAFT_437402 [Powellomyces hirtus]|nr:hypothetical protein DFJ77DRAFT_437402 [Powellomyces hirtus]
MPVWAIVAYPPPESSFHWPRNAQVETYAQNEHKTSKERSPLGEISLSSSKPARAPDLQPHVAFGWLKTMDVLIAGMLLIAVFSAASQMDSFLPDEHQGNSNPELLVIPERVVVKMFGKPDPLRSAGRGEAIGMSGIQFSLGEMKCQMRESGASLSSNLTLLWGNRNEDHMFLASELVAMQKRCGGALRILNLLSNPSPDWEGPLKTGGEWDPEAQQVQYQWEELRIVVCGPPAFNEAAIEILNAFGIPKEIIHVLVLSQRTRKLRHPVLLFTLGKSVASGMGLWFPFPSFEVPTIYLPGFRSYTGVEHHWKKGVTHSVAVPAYVGRLPNGDIPPGLPLPPCASLRLAVIWDCNSRPPRCVNRQTVGVLFVQSIRQVRLGANLFEVVDDKPSFTGSPSFSLAHADPSTI